MPPATIIFRVLILYCIIGVIIYGLIMLGKYFFGAKSRFAKAKIDNKIDIDEFETDIKINDMKTKTQEKKISMYNKLNKVKK